LEIKSSIPVLASIILVLTCFTKPYLNRAESYWFQNNPLLSTDRHNPGFTTIETKVVEKLKAEFIAASKSQ